MFTANPNDPYRLLFEALSRATGPLPAAENGWSSLPQAGELPLPWTAWTLVGLMRHRKRQLWVGEIVTTRLGGDLGQIAAAGALGHPSNRSPHGVVPGLIEWEYRFHGRGCCLTQRVTGETIDVDFFGDRADGIDPYFYFRYLRSVKKPQGPEHRLIQLHPSIESIQLAIEQLCDDGLVLCQSGRKALRFSEGVLGYEAEVETFCDGWADQSRRPWMAAVIGDWIAVAELSNDALGERGAAVVKGRADELRLRRVDWLVERLDGADLPTVLHGLAEVGADVLPATLSRVLRGTIGPATVTAMEIVEARVGLADAGPERWCEDVYYLFRRLDPEGQSPHPVLWSKAVRLLLGCRYKLPEVGAALECTGSHQVGEAALLALEHVPERALGLFRRALRSRVPLNRSVAAAALGIIDRPWSRAELLAILDESDEQDPTTECRAALEESRDAATRQAVIDWELRNPHEREVGPSITVGEFMLQQSASWMRYEMDQLRERIVPLADRDISPKA